MPRIIDHRPPGGELRGTLHHPLASDTRALTSSSPVSERHSRTGVQLPDMKGPEAPQLCPGGVHEPRVINGSFCPPVWGTTAVPKCSHRQVDRAALDSAQV